MADQNDFLKPDSASNFDTEVHQTNHGNIGRAISLDWGSAANVPVGAKRLTEPSAGDIVLERKTIGGQVTIFDSRDKLNKVGDQALIGQLDIKGVDATTRHKRLRFLRYDGTVMATFGQNSLATDNNTFELTLTDPFALKIGSALSLAVDGASYAPILNIFSSTGIVAIGRAGDTANFRLVVQEGFQVQMAPSGGGSAEFSMRSGSNAGGIFAMCGGVGKHRINANVGTEGHEFLDIGNSGGTYGAGKFYTTQYFGLLGNAAGAAFKLMKNGSTGRSLNAEGTINASGADYAEYHRKAPSCGVVAKGEIVGIDASSRVTQRFSEAVRFAIKSTAPAYVGGDVWGSDKALGMAMPERPDPDLPVYAGPPNPGEEPKEASKQKRAEWRRAARDYRVAFDQFQRELAAAEQRYEMVTLPEYERASAVHAEKLEGARAEVDRIAYSGQVPCNALGAEPGDYIVAGEGREGEIEGFPVAAARITFDTYKRAVLRVTQILDDNRAFGAVIVH